MKTIFKKIPSHRNRNKGAYHLFSSLVFFFFNFPFLLLGQIGTDAISYTAAGTYTWTVPACVTQIEVEAWGGGGGGAGGANGGGGGGGAYAKSVIAVTPGQVYTIVVGSAGNGGGGGANGGNGGDSRFHIGGPNLVLAVGGQGGRNNGNGGQAGQASASIGTFAKYNGGDGGAATNGGGSDWGGGGGASAGRSGPGNPGKTAANCGSGWQTDAPGGAAPGGGAKGGKSGYSTNWGNGNPSAGDPGGGAGGGGWGNGNAGAAGGAGKVNINWGKFQIFNTSGTWTCPPGITTVVVQSWGAGGGGGGNETTCYDGSDGGGAGGGGGYSESVLPVVPGTVYNVTIGVGGAPGINGNGAAGGDTWFNTAATILAKGGGGGSDNGNTAGQGGQSGAGIFNVVGFSGGNGGTANNGNYGHGGGGGSSAGTAANGNNGQNGVAGNGQPVAQGGAAPVGGSAGANGGVDHGYCWDANDFGGGGGGSGEVTRGGRGANGQLIIGYQESITIGNNAPSITANSHCPSTLNIPIHSFTLTGENEYDPSCRRNEITGLTFVTTGNYQAGDIANYKLYYSTTNVFSTANLLATITAPAASGTQTFPPFNHRVGSSTYYYWITMDLTAASANNRTIAVNATTPANVTSYPVPRTNTGGYGVASSTQTLLSNPILSSTLTPPTICSGIFNYTATSNPGGATMTWSRATVAGITPTGTSGNGNISETLTNTTNSSINVSYTYTVSANGCSTSTIVVVAVNPLPTATVTGTVTRCLNDPNPTITFTGGGSTAPYTFTYSINGNPNQTVVSNGVGVATLPAPTNVGGTFTYSLISVRDANTCTQVQSGSAVVTVNPLGATLAGSTTVCLNAAQPTITFTGTGGVAPYEFTYNIDGNGNLTSLSNGAGVATVTAPTNVVGDFVYSLTSVQDDAALSCISASSITITVYPLPTATIGSNITVCQNTASPAILFSGSGGSNPYTFSYTENGGAVQTITSAVGSNTVSAPLPISTAIVGDFVYALTNVREGSIAACNQNQTGNTTVTVRSPSQGTVTSSIYRVCENENPPTMTFVGSLGQAPYIFYYSTNVPVGGVTTHSVLSIGNTATVSVPTNVPDTIVFTITNIQDASGILCGIGGSFDTVIVDPLPTSIITAALSNVCLGDPDQVITFTGVGVPAPVTFNYYTSLDGGPNINQTPISSIAPSLTTTISAPATALGTTVYTNGISSSNVCIGSGSGSARLTVNPIPTAAIVGTATICDDNTTAVTFTGAVGTPPFTFTYNIDGGAAQTVTSLSGQYSANIILDTVPGTYVVNLLAVRDTFGCNQAQTGNVTVIVDPLPAATAGGNSSMCLNGTAIVSGATFANGTISWTHNGSGNLTNITTLTPTYTAGTADAGNAITLTMTITSDNSCNPETATATYTVNVDSLPFASAGGSSVICENSNHTVSGANARYGSILWTHNGTGSITNATTLTPTYSAAAGDAGNTVTLTMTVTSTNSCAPQIATANYTINVDRLPTATSAGNTTVCQNTPYTLTNGEATMTNAVVQSWNENGAGSITAGGTSLTPSYTPAVADAGSAVTLTLTVISNNTCSLSSTPTASATYTINIDRLPTATSPGSSTTCQNMATTVTTATQTNGNPTWGHNGTGTITNGNTLTPTYTPGAADASLSVVLTLTVTSSNTCSLSTAPTATSTYTVNVDPLPTATITGSSTICQNMTTTVNTASLTNGTPAWTDNGIGTITSGANSLTPTYSAAADDAGNTVTLTMTVMSNNSCSLSPTPTATASYPVTIDPIPTATGGSGTPVCYDQPAVVSGMGLTNGIPTWTENGAGTLTNQNTQNPTYTPNISDAGNPILLTMTVTSNNTCSLSAVPTATATYTFSVRSLMTVTMDVIPSKGWVCQGDEAKLNFKVSNGSGQGPYQIGYNSPGGSSTASSVGNNQTIITDVNTDMPGVNTFTLTSVSDKFCTQQISATATLTVLALPEATVIGGVGVCKGALSPEVTFIGSSANPPASPYKIDFTINGKNASISTRVGQDSVNLTSPTDVEGSIIYTITQVTDANGCSQQISGQSTTMDVYVVPLADFTISTENTSILRPEVDVYDASASGQSWLWDFGDGSLSNLPDPLTHSYADTGIYTISLLLTNGVCRDSTYQVVRIYFPKMLYIPSAFTPNGDGENEIFSPKGEGFTDYELMIFDRWGMLLFYSDDINKGWDGKANGGSEIAQQDAYIYVVNITAIQDKHDYTYRGVFNLIK